MSKVNRKRVRRLETFAQLDIFANIEGNLNRNGKQIKFMRDIESDWTVKWDLNVLRAS